MASRPKKRILDTFAQNERNRETFMSKKQVLKNKDKIEHGLQNKLNKLKGKFDTGHDLKLIYLPGGNRINDNVIRLAGEIQNNIILIYDDKEPEETLTHEFIEYIINILTQDYLLIINNKNRVIERLLNNQKETIVNRLTKGLV